MANKHQPQSTYQKVLRSIRSKGFGSIHVPKDFLPFGSRAAVDVALARLCKAGVIRRIRHGVYDYPMIHSKLGRLSPSLPRVAQAVARSGGLDLQPSGALAANALGLSTQVPAQLVYLTNGTSRVIRIGRQEILFKHSTRRGMLGAGTTAGLVIQALRHIGRDSLTNEMHSTLAHRLSNQDKKDLARLSHHVPAWMRAPIDAICSTTRAA